MVNPNLGEETSQRSLPLFLDEFEMKDYVLYYVRHFPNQVFYQFVVPKALWSAALLLAHASLTIARQGNYVSYVICFAFPNMLHMVKYYVASCQACQQCKGHFLQQSFMQHYCLRRYWHILCDNC